MRMSIIAIAVFFLGTAVTSAAETDTAAANEALIRHELEALNRRDWKTAVQAFAVDASNFSRPVGRAVIARAIEDTYRTFPDFRLEITDV